MANEIADMFMNIHKRDVQAMGDIYNKEVVPAMLNVDNHTTSLPPQFSGTGSHAVDKMNAMARDQGLYDNTLDLVAVGKLAKGFKPSGKLVEKSPYKNVSDLDKAYPGNPSKLLSDAAHKQIWMEKEARKYGKTFMKKQDKKISAPEVVNAVTAVLQDPKVTIPSSLYINKGFATE